MDLLYEIDQVARFELRDKKDKVMEEIRRSTLPQELKEKFLKAFERNDYQGVIAILSTLK